MATYEELKNKYKGKHSEAIVAPVVPATPTDKGSTSSYEDLKKQYDSRSSTEVTPEVTPEVTKKNISLQDKLNLGIDTGEKISAYEGPEIIDRQEDSSLEKAAKLIYSKEIVEGLGFKERPEKTIQQKMQDQETARQSYYRDKEFTTLLDLSKKADPERFEMPEGYKEPEAIGQLFEGIHSGFRSMLLPAIGYFIESSGRSIGSPNMVKWGMEAADAAMVDYISRPELMRPDDLKPFLDGGFTDLRAYGRTIGEIIPFMGTVIALSTAGGLVGGPGGALAAGWAAAAAIEQGNAYKEYIDSGVAPDKAADASFIYGLIAGGIENMMGVKPAGIANKILNPTKLATDSFKSYVLKELPNMALQTIKMAVGEGSEEVLQQLTQDMMGKWAGSEEGISTLKELGEQFVAGTIGSLPFGAVSTFRMPSIKPTDVVAKQEVTPITPIAEEEIVKEKEEEAKITAEEEKATKVLKEAVTGQPITIEKSYAGIKDGVDSGFRTVERTYAQGYADMKGGELTTFTKEVLNNPYVTDGHKAVLNSLRETFPNEVANIEKRYESRIALQAEATGIFAAGPDITQPVDDFIREKLISQGFDSLIYTRSLDAAEYQIFNKVLAKPEVTPITELAGKKLTVEPGAFKGVPIVTPEGKPITQIAEEAIPKELEPSVEVAQILRESKGVSADDIMAKHPDINLKRDVHITDIYGKKSVIEEDEALTPYELKGNKVLLQDGETYIVSKAQLKNVMQNAEEGVAKEFAPKLKETEETVKVDKQFGTLSRKQLDDIIADANKTNKQLNYYGIDKSGAKVKILNKADLEKYNKFTADYFAEGPTKYYQYQLPGGKNYKEILIKGKTPYDLIDKNTGEVLQSFDNVEDARKALEKKPVDDRIFYQLKPSKGYGGTFKSPHWEELNVISHIRLNERIYKKDDVTFLEELQSDWAKEGREKGFAGDKGRKVFDDYVDTLKKKYNTDATIISQRILTSEEKIKYQKLFDSIQDFGDGVPQNPLLKNWQELSLKRALQEAVKNKSDYFAWINGEQTSARYNLSTHLENVKWNPRPHNDLIKEISLKSKDGKNIRIDVGKDGIIQNYDENWKYKKLDEVLGKGLADKIMASEKGKLSAEGLKFGGEWAINLYDKQVPNIVKDLTGAEVIKMDMGLPIGAKDINVFREVERTTTSGHIVSGRKITVDDLKVGKEILSGATNEIAGEAPYIITDVLGKGKFKAVPKDVIDEKFNKWEPYVLGSKKPTYQEFIDKEAKGFLSEQFDISVKKTTQQGIKLTPEVKAIIKSEAPAIKPASGKTDFIKAAEEVKENLPKANLITTVKNTMGKSSYLPILSNFLVKNGKLTATDLDVGIRLNTDLKDGVYKIVGKDAVASDIEVEDFPLVPELKGKLVGTISSETLADSIKKASLSISKDQVHPELSAVLLEIKNNVMIVASTDSYRLFRETILLKGENANVKLLIPAEKIHKILANMDSALEIYNQPKEKNESGMVHFRGKYGDVAIRKVDGDFPAYEEIYPELTNRYVFDRKQLLANLKELKPFVDYSQGISLTYKDGKMDLFAENKAEKVSKKITLNVSKQKIDKVNAGSGNDGVMVMQIKGDSSPKVEEFKFNVKYLIDVMNSLKEDRIFMYSSDQIADTPKIFSEKNKLKSVPQLKGSANATIGKFREGEDIELGNMDKVRPIEFPELVELSRDLMGRVPEVSRRLRIALGKFYGTEKGRIKLTPAIFKDEAQASRVLAHEIGHLVDYLPEQTLKRGNLLGSLLSLRGFLNSTFGVEGALDLAKIRNQATREILAEENIPFADLRTGKLTQEAKDKIKTRYNKLVTETGAMKDAEIRKELQVVTHYWRPYKEDEVTASYNNYRSSSRELYADAISLLFNSPGTLERLAPKFYKGFFDALDAKPEVKNAYFDIQEVLSHDRATLIALRRKRTQEMFNRADYKSEELQKVEEESRKFRLKKFWDGFTYSIRSINQPIYDKVKQAETEGKYIPDDENPKYLLSGQNYLSGEIKARFEESIQPVMDDLIKNEIGWQTFGEFLLYERVAEGDRSDFANPGGINKSDATERIATLKQSFGEERFKVLEKSADSFRNFLKGLSAEAFEAGMITSEMKKTMETNEKYSPFQVVEYMEKNVSWKVKPQIGTLKDINNPANSLLLKAISTIRAVETQKNRMATFKMLEANFSDEIKEAELQFSGKARMPIDTKEDGMGMVTYYKEGKLRGKYVDQHIAKSLDRDSIARNKAVMTILAPISYLNKKMFRPLFVIYNPGWIPFNFIRDYMRFWKNAPNLSFIGAAKRYGQAFRAAKVRAFGMSKKETAQEIEARNVIRQLEKEKVLSVTWNDMLAGQDIEDSQIQGAMETMGLSESKKEIPSMYKPVMAILERFKIISLLKGIRKTGDLIETLPKVAGYFELEGKMQPEKMREFVRKNIGSPDFFEKGFLTPATNNIFLFSNAFLQAVTADTYIATNPSTRSGFWWKTAKVIITPKILMFAALMGAFGDDLKKWMSDASEYDMTNYFIIPVGRDTNSGKTIYLRIPMDETSRLIGGLFWKMMRASSNVQSFGRDVMDIASLFGGQLPTWSPTISVPASAFTFAFGQNPYDSFRGRTVLTDKQMQAGGMYALKPFLLWEFQQMGGNIFTKLYSGEQVPREKSAGEKFLQLPVISNIVGRFVRISDYGQLEKYREKTYEIKGEKARERIDENKTINEYVKKYQEKKGDLVELNQDLIMDVLGHAVSSREEALRANNIRKKFRISIEKGKADPKINAMIYAVSNEEKVTLLRVYKELMSEKDFKELRTDLLKYKIISGNVLFQLNKPIKP